MRSLLTLRKRSSLGARLGGRRAASNGLDEADDGLDGASPPASPRRRGSRRVRASTGSFRGRDTFPDFNRGDGAALDVVPVERGVARAIADVDDEDAERSPAAVARRVDAAVAAVEAACRRVEPPHPRLKDIVDEVLTNAREEGRPAREVFEVIDPAGARALAPADFVRGLRELDTDRLLDADGRRPTLEFLGFVEPFERHGDGKVHMAPFETYCAALQAPPWARDAASRADALPPLAASATRAPSPRGPRAAAPAAFRTTF